MKEGIKLILRYFLAVIVWGLISAGMLYGFFSLFRSHPPDEFLFEPIAGSIIIIASIVASYCIPKEQRFYFGIILSVWFVFFGGFLNDMSLITLAFSSALISSLFHYLKNNKLFIKYFLGAVLVLFVLPFFTGERDINFGIIQLIGYFIPAERYEIFYCMLLWLSLSAVYFGTTLLGAYFLPSPHRRYFALFITITGSLPRLIMMIRGLVINSGFWPIYGAIVFFGSFASGTIAAVLFLYWRQKKLENRVDHSFQKTP